MESEVKSETVCELDINIEPGYDTVDFDIEEEKPDLVFVDIQGFRNTKNRFICKEFCLVSTDEKYHVIVKSPYGFEKLPSYYKRQANWLTKYFHGIAFNDGDVHLIDVLQTVYKKILGKKIIVKGAHKVIWMKYIFRNCGEIDCVNIEDLGYSQRLCKTSKLGICYFHHKMYWKEWRCALTTALQLQTIVEESNLDI